MSVPAFGPSSSAPDAARSVSDIAELLDVVYESARQAVPTSPVSTTQLRLMFLLDRRPGIRMSALAQLLGAGAPSVTRLCDRLEATGFLRRHPSPGDGRELTPRLTPAGERHLAQIREKRQQTLAQALDTMSADARHALTTGLAALQEGITSTTGSPQQNNPAA
ncbi:MarR family winged helix-turn-helix transcriptional regulator [Streptomyces sp. NBC_01264]|uniref:MarR family winged helix-turn-helix transcriptional regulator n=1 Tax=Streptomyces sp. NBC_01264 TaxID=2903804 RepID=UPI002259B2B3|nr:MarR family transcriptional regulator [Streptomyces sp. NBC_01264]MCX4776156.1 MarR family transcriptional regulator [Streptomyces sp. NBC_01264]